MTTKDIQDSAKRMRRAVTHLELDAGELALAMTMEDIGIDAYRDNVQDALGRVRNELDMVQAWTEGTLGK